MFNTKITRSCDDVVENASSPSPFHVRTVPVDLYRPVSQFRWFQIRDSARECTGHDRNLLSPSPRVVQLSALFVAAVQSYHRQCVVLRCPIDIERFETTPQIDDGVALHNRRTSRRCPHIYDHTVTRPES